MEGKTLVRLDGRNSFNWITQQWRDFGKIKRRRRFPAAAFKDTQTDRDLAVDLKNSYANAGQEGELESKGGGGR